MKFNFSLIFYNFFLQCVKKKKLNNRCLKDNICKQFISTVNIAQVLEIQVGLRIKKIYIITSIIQVKKN